VSTPKRTGPDDVSSEARSAKADETPSSKDDETTTCPHCGESRDLAKVKGCIKCLTCGFKFDCNGW
jgi:hypothetical protein